MLFATFWNDVIRDRHWNINNFEKNQHFYHFDIDSNTITVSAAGTKMQDIGGRMKE